MAQTAPEHDVFQLDGSVPDVPRIITGVTWRYLGERVAADSAYCARFGVSHAPEPMVAQDGAWAYVLPAAQATR